MVFAPFRGFLWLYDRYALGELYYRIFYNKDRTIGVVPKVAYATGYGLMGGAQLTSTDTFGDGETLSVGGTYGGIFQARAFAWLDSGLRLDPVTLTIGGNFDQFGRQPFYGIGNNEDLSPPPAMLISPSLAK